MRIAPPPLPARSVIQPLAPERYKLQLTIAKDTHDTLRQLQDLLRHSIPDGDPSEIVDRALRLLLEDVLRQKCAMTERPRQRRGIFRLARHPRGSSPRRL